MYAPSHPTIIVGLTAEARIARPLGWPIAVGGGRFDGAVGAAEQAIRDGAKALVSFGLAGGLDPGLRPGTVLVPDTVIVEAAAVATDAALRARLGRGGAAPILGARDVAATVAVKQSLFTMTGAAAVDLESGAVALTARRHGVPFAVLRAICDPADRDLPQAALIALDQGGMIGMGRVLGSVAARPWQIPALVRLARDAGTARRALHFAVRNIT